MIRDRAGRYTIGFDDIFRSIGADVILTPPQAPQANAFAERWVRSVRHELLDRTLIWNQRQLHRLLDDYVEHYNTHRPHRSLEQHAPQSGTVTALRPQERLERHTVCGGLISEYGTLPEHRGQPSEARTSQRQRARRRCGGTVIAS